MYLFNTWKNQGNLESFILNIMPNHKHEHISYRQERLDRIGGSWSLSPPTGDPARDSTASGGGDDEDDDDFDDDDDDADYDYIDDDDNEDKSSQDDTADPHGHDTSETNPTVENDETESVPTSAEMRIAAKFRTEKARLDARLAGLVAQQEEEERRTEAALEAGKQELEREYSERLVELEQLHATNMAAVKKKFALEKRHLEVNGEVGALLFIYRALIIDD